jgi:hypothetical protein
VNDRARRAARIFEIPVIVAALLTIPTIATEQSSLDEPWAMVAAVLNWTIWLVFLAELGVMLALVPDRQCAAHASAGRRAAERDRRRATRPLAAWRWPRPAARHRCGGARCDAFDREFAN